MPKASDAPANPMERYQRAMKDLKKSRDEEERWVALADAAKAAAWIGKYAEAGQYAGELRVLTPRHKDSWNQGNAVHAYNTAFGFISLNRGDKESAKRYLLASGRTPGSPQIDSFGPNMSLALALLLSGEKSAVISYLDLCQKFWPREELKDWKKTISSDRIPNFGANLVY